MVIVYLLVCVCLNGSCLLKDEEFGEKNWGLVN